MFSKRLALVFVVLAILSFVVSCGESGGSDYDDIFTSDNETLSSAEPLLLVHDDVLLRLRFELPPDWDGNFTVEPINWPYDMAAEERAGGEGVDVRTSWGGLLFQIFKHPTSTWSGLENLPPVRNEAILETEDYIFVMTLPSDVQWRDSNEEAVHNQMSEEIANIRFSLSNTQ